MMRPTSAVLASVLSLFAMATPGHSADPPDVTLKVSRKSDFRSYFITQKVFLNDKLVASVGSGESKIVPLTGVTPGPCTLKTVCWTGDGQQLGSETRDLIIPCRNAVVEVGVDTGRSNLFTKISGDLVDTSVAKVLSVKFDKELKAVVVKTSPAIKLPAGATKTVEDTIRVKHSVTLTEGWTAAGEVKSKVKLYWLPIEGGVRYEVQKSTSQSYETETERKRSVTLTGNGTSASSVVWVEYYRTGTAKVSINGSEIELPFEFREDFDLVAEESK
jgi:hypothetical protein